MKLKNITAPLIVCILFNCLYCSKKQSHPAQNGMVVSSQHLASEVGIKIMRAGGNAVDAAVAVGFALAVVHPTAGNLGGGGFMVIRFPDGNATTIDFREKAPKAATRNMYLNNHGEVIPEASTIGYGASGVPGTVAGLILALNKYGTKTLEDVIQPAIELASDGFTLSTSQAANLNKQATKFSKFESTRKIFVKKDGQFKKGNLLIQKDLAKTLTLIAQKGRDGFYNGVIADLIVEDMRRQGGLITYEDLASYQAIEREPIFGTYRGYEIISMGLSSSGGIALVEMFNMLELLNLNNLGHNSAEYVHYLIEVMRSAFADRAYYLGDADFISIPQAGLTAKSYASELFKTIPHKKARSSREVSYGSPNIFESFETTHYSVADKEGLAVSTTTTLNGAYGCKVVIDGAGFFMNNEMDDFSIKPGVPNMYGLIGGEANAIEPGKRMLSSMSPTIIQRDKKLLLVVGSPGGPQIINAVLQVILNVLDFNLDIQEAVDAPRFHHQWLPDSVYYEKKHALGEDVIAELSRMGYKLKAISVIGETHAIFFDSEKQLFYGGADSRYEGKAVGY